MNQLVILHVPRDSASVESLARALSARGFDASVHTEWDPAWRPLCLVLAWSEAAAADGLFSARAAGAVKNLRAPVALAAMDRTPVSPSLLGIPMFDMANWAGGGGEEEMARLLAFARASGASGAAVSGGVRSIQPPRAAPPPVVMSPRLERPDARYNASPEGGRRFTRMRLVAAGAVVVAAILTAIGASALLRNAAPAPERTPAANPPLMETSPPVAEAPSEPVVKAGPLPAPPATPAPSSDALRSEAAAAAARAALAAQEARVAELRAAREEAARRAASSRVSLPPAPPPPPPPPVVAPPPAPVPMPVSQTLIFFNRDSAALEPVAAEVLDETVSRSRQGNVAAIRVRASTDTALSTAESLALSRRMAETVRNALVARGMPADLITTEALGESDLAVQTADGTSEPLNRRVEITITYR